MAHIVLKIVPAEIWAQAEAAGVFKGASIDLADGFIHLSTPAQAPETANLYFKGRTGLLLVSIDGDALGEKLVYEASRNGDLFPHYYGELPLSAVIGKAPMIIGDDGNFVF